MPETLPKMRNRLFWMFVQPFQRAYQYLIRPQGKAVKVLVVNKDRFLLVRPANGHKKWSIPGGRVNRDESYEDAARRQVKEETGLSVQELMPLGIYTSNVNFGTYSVYTYFVTTDQDEIQPDQVEIQEVMWASPEDLPQDRVSRVDQIIALYEQHKTS